MTELKCILLISGKRKSGKDFISDKLLQSLGLDTAVIVRISEPIKSVYAAKHNLDLSQLMSDNPYKENYRKNMIIWSDSIRLENPGYFCEEACKNAPHKAVWIVSDIRRQTDIQWFSETFNNKIKTIRIICNDAIRTSRGWKFVKGIDDVASECDLDGFTNWDLIIENNHEHDTQNALDKILNLIHS